MNCSKCLYFAILKPYSKCLKFNMFVDIARNDRCKGFLFVPKTETNLFSIHDSKRINLDPKDVLKYKE